MAFKGTAAKSSSGASMSKYDVEVEGRLKALETAVAALQADSHPDRSGGGGGGDRVDKLIDLMTTVPAFANEMPAHTDEETGKDDHYLDF